MDTNLIIGYAGFLIAVLTLIATIIKPRARTKTVFIIVALLILISTTFVLWGPLKIAIEEAFSIPDIIEEADTVEENAAEAWGPKDRELFTWEKPATYPTFNSITDNPNLGHESNFVRIREAGVGTYSDDVDIVAGKEYEVFIYYHNDADVILEADGMADNVRVRSNFPTKLEAGEVGQIKAIISSTNTEPLEVWDTAYIHCEDDLVLMYVPNSAVLHNWGTGENSTDGTILDSESLFGGGAKIGYDSRAWGFVPGGNEYAGYIVYKINVE
ncbi:MAG: hypothetical protein IJ153_04225 [Clostridia bacterium]|nr:hypothetical protein [Clostridia bacterium]